MLPRAGGSIKVGGNQELLVPGLRFSGPDSLYGGFKDQLPYIDMKINAIKYKVKWILMRLGENPINYTKHSHQPSKDLTVPILEVRKTGLVTGREGGGARVKPRSVWTIHFIEPSREWQGGSRSSARGRGSKN